MNANANEAYQRKKYSDKQLLSNILAFAKPYWKLFLFSLLLTAFIVMAGLAQPYIIKVAIDQHINGIYAPMVYVNQSEKDQALHTLEERGVKGKEVTTFKDHTYFRLNEAKTEMPGNFQKARIVSIEGTNYLIHGWNTSIKNPDALQISNNHISINDNLYPVTSLKGDTEQLFRSQDYTGLIWLGILYFVLIIGSSVFTYFQNNTLQFTGQSVIYDIRETIMRHLSQMQISFYDKNHPDNQRFG
ncbi:ABC transporter transmembrane domain-containing protein [Bacillus sp. REN16]|uniref:ABC transporter transmembrane domain-containing protein n=1 Tax=Bacillus sp. REN16 TaxID=2887296 RepID=UPI001E4FBF06|nr:ABC transporter transmembrane domain-containing protein [Bacillus sp. REN16]MCC3357131.1 hypothetical protein [Bacillus sp. REN16]